MVHFFLAEVVFFDVPLALTGRFFWLWSRLTKASKRADQMDHQKGQQKVFEKEASMVGQKVVL